MPPIRHDPIIEIESSPEPYPNVRTTRSTSRARSVGASNAASEAKKRPKTPKARMGPVIELTDSESDEFPKAAARRRELSPVAGPSNAAGPSNVAGPSNAAKHKTTLNNGGLLFFPSDDDGDNENVPVGDLVREIQNIPVELPPVPAPMEQDDPLPPPPPPPPEEPIDPISHTLAQILEIIPDIDPEHALGLVQEHLPAFGDLNDNSNTAALKERTTRAAEHVIGLVFEAGAYPKAVVVKKGKVKAVEEPERENKRPKIDYKSVERLFMGGKDYFELALIHLQISFPHIPKAHIRRVLLEHKSFYAPTHLAIAEREKQVKDEMALLGTHATGLELSRRLGYSAKSTKYNPAKDRRRKLADEVFEEERVWLQAHLKDMFGVDLEGFEGVGAGGQGGNADKGKGKAVALPEEDDEVEDGTGIECQCCFAEYPFDKMVQCPEAHLFCSTCISTYASTQLSSNSASLTCMHPSTCSLPFPPSELRRILAPTLMSLYERVVQQKEVAEAGLEGLEECPWCEWKCVMEAEREQDRLFRCGNEEGGCGVVSCRFCWKKDHLPKSCKEVEEDKKLDGRHSIEEAMTAAMMRNCPKCKKAFIKEEGCNKMTCPNCRTLSCYVCRQVVTGYEHFDQQQRGPGQPSTSMGSKKCLLWDKVEERHVAEVKAAAEKALAEYKELHPDVAEEDIKVDLPVAPPPPPPAPPYPGVNAGMMRHLPNAVGLAGNPGGGGGGAAGWGYAPAVGGAAAAGGWGGAGAGWGAPAGFGVDGAQPNALGMLFNPYVHVPVPVPALPPPAPAPRARRNVRVRRGQLAAANAVAGPANQRGGNARAPIVAAAAAAAADAPPRATRAARVAVANPPQAAANALAIGMNPFAPPPPRAARGAIANPPQAAANAPPRAVRADAVAAAPPPIANAFAFHVNPFAAPAAVPALRHPPAAAVPVPRPRKAARAADRQAHMEEARAAMERQRAQNELRMARGRQEAAQMRARLEGVREAMVGGANGGGGGGGKRRAGAR